MGFLDGALGGAIGAVGSLIGGGVSASQSKANSRLNYEAQKEFAQNGIRWRVEDAKRAGIHPLYALGANTASFSPVQGYGGDFGVSDAFANFGQGIDRAVQAKMTRQERDREDARQEMQDVFTLARFQADQRYQDAQVRLIDSEIARNRIASMVSLKYAARIPPMPGSPTLLSGQGDALPVGTKEAPYWDNSIPQMGFSHDASGKLIDIIPSDPYAQRTEDKLIVEWLPWLQALWQNVKAKGFGRSVGGYWWHGDDKGYLPYPPKKGGSSGKMASSYYNNSARYR